MQELLRKNPGVIETEVGYTGGTTSSPMYDDVSQGDTGHAEAVRIVFEPTKLAYADLLEKWFFRMHAPTTKNRQHNDEGTQYRSAIFVLSEEQRAIAKQVISRVQASGRWKAPIVTEIEDTASFMARCWAPVTVAKTALRCHRVAHALFDFLGLREATGLVAREHETPVQRNLEYSAGSRHEGHFTKLGRKRR